MEIQDPNPIAVDNSELGPNFRYDENYRTLRQDMFTITKVLGGAILGGCVDVAKSSYGRAKSLVSDNIPSRTNVEPVRRSVYLRSKNRFIANPDAVGLNDIDYFSGTESSIPSEIVTEKENIN